MDLISQLPDDQISHILYFLPTENAMATTILSRRWRHSWTLLDTIDLDEFNFMTLPSLTFVKAVAKELILLNRAFTLKRVLLNWLRASPVILSILPSHVKSSLTLSSHVKSSPHVESYFFNYILINSLFYLYFYYFILTFFVQIGRAHV